MAKANFFSVLLDGSTDTANIENEIILVVWCDTNGTDEKVHTRMEFLTVVRPESATARGLFKVLEIGLQHFGIQELSTEECAMLVGIGTDGAAANIAASGLKGLVENQLQWVFWMWCMAHRLELAIKDALKGTFFDNIDEMLLRLYYLYEKSPKRCRELEDIITDLKECLCFDNAGVRPVRASGSRWVTHKLNAMKRILSKFGAYVLGCAVFVDLLSPCSMFSRAMQNDEIDILGALTGVLQTLKETNRLGSKGIEQWPTYAATMRKIVLEGEENDSAMYQCQELKNYSAAASFYTSKHKEYADGVVQCIKSRLSWSDLDLMRAIIFVLSTHGWEKALEEENDMQAVDHLVQRFATPLERAGVETDEVTREFREMITYATQYISLSVLDYHSVWWRLFHAPCSSEWTNALALAKLLFSLPASNGKLEQIFSLLKIIKVNKHSLLSNEALDDLLLLNSDKTPLEKFDPNPAIDLWLSSKPRRLSQKARKPYKPRSSASDEQSTSRSSETTTDTDESDTGDTLADWDNLIQVSD